MCRTLKTITSVAETDSSLEPESRDRREAIMSIEGTIVSVMESWPLQLVVENESGRWQVALRDDTAITVRGSPADPGQIRPGARVRIEGPGSGPNAILAASLEIA